MSTVFRPGNAGVLVVAAVTAAAAAGLFARQPDVERAVLASIDRINTAFQARDAQAYERLTTPGFVRVTSTGRVFGRAEWLQRSVAAPGPARQAGTYDQSSVRVYGTGAVVTYRNNPDGKAGVPGYLTRIMERQGTEWRMALALSTDLKAPAAPTGPEPAALPAWSATTAAEKEALAAFEAIQKANRDRDVALWERHSAPDHVIIGADATRVSRADRVAQLTAPPAANAAAPGAQSQVRLTMAGSDLAAVTWTTPTARSLKVLARQNGVWRQVLQQSAPILRAR
jgi:hypothetical protein